MTHLLVSKCPHEINLKTDSAGLLVNEVWRIPHHRGTLVTQIQTNGLLFFVVQTFLMPKTYHVVCESKTGGFVMWWASRNPSSRCNACSDLRHASGFCPFLECAAWLKCVSINDTVDEILLEREKNGNRRYAHELILNWRVEFLKSKGLFSLPVSYHELTEDRKDGTRVDLWPCYSGMVLMLPPSHPIPSPVANHTDSYFTSPVLKPRAVAEDT